MKFFTYILIIILSLAGYGCSKEEVSQPNPKYRGIVVNALTQAPFVGIHVAVTNGADTKVTTTTNQDGAFEFSLNIESLTSDYVIKIGNPDTENKEIPIRGVGKAENDLGTISIIPNTVPECEMVEIKLVNGVIHLYGRVLTHGFSAIQSVGFCYGPIDEINEDNFVKATLTDNSFHATIDEDELASGIKYFFFAYCENSAGKGFSQSKELSPSSFAPTVWWQSNRENYDSSVNLINNSATSIKLSAIVKSDGGSQLTECGICWCENGLPDINGQNVFVAGVKVGQYFYVQIEGLMPFTTYTFRPYAKNRIGGIGYGEVSHITTEFSALAAVSLSSELIVNATSVDCKGMASYSNCTLSKVGFCYSESGTPTIDNMKIDSQTVSRNFDCKISGLNQGSNYYIRPYALTTTDDLFYGNLKYITTLVDVKVKIVDESGSPIQGAVVLFADGDMVQIKTNSSGEAEKAMTVGRHLIVVTSYPYNQQNISLDIDKNYQTKTIVMTKEK